MAPDRRDHQVPELVWRQRVWERWKLLGWRQLWRMLFGGIVVGGGMAGWVLLVGYGHYEGIIVGLIAGVGTVVMLLVI
jgi:hypothetical protein